MMHDDDDDDDDDNGGDDEGGDERDDVEMMISSEQTPFRTKLVRWNTRQASIVAQTACLSALSLNVLSDW